MGQRKRHDQDIHGILATHHKHYTSPEDLLQHVGFEATQKYLASCMGEDKLEFDEVRQELHNIKDCNEEGLLRRLSMGFAALFYYAMNLFTCPWKREFRTIKTYGGYYNIHVKSVLKDPTRIFQLMGYVEKDDVLKLEGSVNKERVLDVAVCCLIASCEVCVVIDVYVALNKECSVSDILECRRRTVGSASDCVSWIRGSYFREPETGRLKDVVSRSSFAASERYKEPFDVRDLRKEGLLNRDHWSDSHQTSRGTGSSTISSDRAINFLKEELPLEPMVSKFSHDSDLPKTIANLDESSEEEIYQPASHDKHVEQSLQVLENESPSAKDMDSHDKGSFQDWSIVYATLGKDYYVGDRGDITAQLAPEVTTVKTKPVKVLRMRELPREVVADGGSPVPLQQTSNVVDSSPVSKHDPDWLKVDLTSTDVNSGVWNCPKCTSLNVSSAVVCSICSASRRGHTRTLPSGAPECRQCTLVNKIGATQCEVCGNPLVGSPTYI